MWHTCKSLFLVTVIKKESTYILATTIWITISRAFEWCIICPCSLKISSASFGHENRHFFFLWPLYIIYYSMNNTKPFVFQILVIRKCVQQDLICCRPILVDTRPQPHKISIHSSYLQSNIDYCTDTKSNLVQNII